MLLTIKKMIAIYLAIIFFVGLDRFLKIIAAADKDLEFNLIGEAFKFNYQANDYIAFSLPLAGTWLAVIIWLIIIVLIIFAIYYYQKREYAEWASLSLVIFGASSNLFDRVRYGWVVDYFDLAYFTIFNIADVLIVLGVMLFIMLSYKKQAGSA